MSHPLTKMKGGGWRRSMLVLVVLNLVTTIATTGYTYYERRTSFLEYTDRVLGNATRFGRELLRAAVPVAPTSREAMEPYRERVQTLLSDSVKGSRIRSVYVVAFEGNEVAITASGSDVAPMGTLYPSAPASLRRALMEHVPVNDDYRDSYGRWISHFLPVQAPSGEWFVVAADIPEDVIFGQLNVRLRNQCAIGVGSFLLTSLFAVLASRRVRRRIDALAQAAEDLVARNFRPDPTERAALEELAAGEADEVALVGQALGSVTAALDEHIAKLEATTAAKNKIEGELNVARDIQLGLLPKIFPPFPNRPEFDLFATIHPAKEVGGDFYDFFWVDDHRMFFAVADVSDKGVPAALFMAVTKTLLKTYVAPELSLPAVIAKVNDQLAQGNDNLMFVTLFAAILDVRTGEVEFCDGGHNPPFLMPANGEIRMIEKKTGIALGIAPGFCYQSVRLVLQPGDSLFLYTDGVTEAMNGVHQTYGEERVVTLLESLRRASLRDMLGDVNQALRSYAGGEAQSDDITMLALRFRGPAKAHVASSGGGASAVLESTL